MAYTREQMAELGLLPLYVRRSVLMNAATADTTYAAEDGTPARALSEPARALSEPAQTANVTAAKMPNDARTAALALVKTKPTPIAVVNPPSGKAPVKITADTHVQKIAQSADWSQLKQLVADCKACQLCEQRKQTVFGVGNEKLGASTWLFVGEGPGADEDEQGEPFVGQAGKLLESMLFAAGLKRGREVYIANVVKCRPPGNRQPTGDEAAACASFLDRQIALIQPKIIVALGRTAVSRLLGRDITMGEARGQRFENAGIPVVATYHPSYLLRTPSDKRKAWDDLLFAKEVFKSIA
jgi:uracil-DNA glycosylase